MPFDRMIHLMSKRVRWSRDQRLVTFRLYCRTPFGRLHRNNPEIIELARLIGRTPSAVAMKAVNFASLDPVQQARNIAGLGTPAMRTARSGRSSRKTPSRLPPKPRPLMRD